MRIFSKYLCVKSILLIICFLCAFGSVSGEKGKWGTAVDGLRCRIWFYGAEPFKFKRERSLHLQFEIQNVSDHEIIIAKKHIGSDFFPFLVINLKDSNGIERICAPWYKPKMGFPSYWPLKPGEIVHWLVDLQFATQAHQWNWWKGYGFPPGDYEIYLKYQYPDDLLKGELSPLKMHEYEKNEDILSVWRREQARNDKTINVWHGELSAKPREFTILKESSYGEYRPAGEEAKVLSYNKFGFPGQVVYSKEGKTVREHYYSTDDWITRYYLNFEMLYDNPTTPAKWQRKKIPVSTLTVKAGVDLWQPSDNNATGMFRMWSRFPDGRGYFNQIVKAHYKDGKLEGEFYTRGIKANL